jgi:hypothetical protein
VIIGAACSTISHGGLYHLNFRDTEDKKLQMGGGRR